MKILLIRFSSLGDLITLEVAFRAYRHFFKEEHLTLLTSNLGKGVYQDTNYFDEYIVGKNFRERLRLLRKNEYDLIINLQCTRPSHWITLFSKKRKLINQSASMLQKYFYVKPKVKSHKDILIDLGYDRKEVEIFFQSNSTISLPYISTIFPWSGQQKKVVALAPGASERWESKKWGDQYYLELTGKLLSAGYIVVLIGSALEQPIGKEIEKAFPQSINMIDKTNLSQLKGLLASVDLLVCNDSGPAHLAAAVGTNTLTIFGSTDIKHCVAFGGYYGKHKYVVSDLRLSCQPCYKSKCPTQHECMNSISVMQISSLVNESIEQ